jgi:hypothetical protein
VLVEASLERSGHTTVKRAVAALEHVGEPGHSWTRTAGERDLSPGPDRAIGRHELADDCAFRCGRVGRMCARSAHGALRRRHRHRTSTLIPTPIPLYQRPSRRHPSTHASSTRSEAHT